MPQNYTIIYKIKESDFREKKYFCKKIMKECYRTSITPSHIHLYVIHYYGENINDWSITEYCINNDSIRITDLGEHFENTQQKEEKIKGIKKEGVKIHNEAEGLIENFVENFFLSIERLKFLFNKGEGDCVCTESLEDYGKLTYLNLTSYSFVGIETTIEFNPLAKTLFISRKDCSMMEDSNISELNEVSPNNLNWFNIDQKEFDVMYSLCISGLNYAVYLLKNIN